MTIIPALPTGLSATSFGAFAALSFVLAATMLEPTLDPDAGIPDVSELFEAHGRVTSVSSHKYGVRFRLDSRAETFDYPSKAGGYGIVKSALVAAGNREVAVLFDPTPRIPWLSSAAYYDVWQLSIHGKSVRTAAESKEGWRSNNAVGRWLFATFLIIGLYHPY